MKVIFFKDVPSVARAGEVKEVSDGYARNYLIPKKLAAVALPDVQHQVEAEHRVASRRQAHAEAEMETLAKNLEGKEITLRAKVGAKDQLYGSITNANIATELSRVLGSEIDKRKVELSEPIRHTGTFEATVRLSAELTPKIKVNVSARES